jgi:multiple sugar transport system substrate-binding protein
MPSPFMNRNAAPGGRNRRRAILSGIGLLAAAALTAGCSTGG